MRIGSSLNSNICVNSMSRKIVQKKNDEVNLSSANKVTTKSSPVMREVDYGTFKFKTIYNKATLQNIDKVNDDNLDDSSNEELSQMLDRDLYDKCHLKKLGIEYGSKEYEQWKGKWKDNFVVPLEAPLQVRKKLINLIDQPRDGATQADLVNSIWQNLKGVDKSNPKTYFDLCSKVISENTKFISSMNSSGAVSNPYIKAAVDLKKNVNECFFKLRLDLDDMINR